MTGVFKQQLGQIETREAASNVKYGARQSTVLTKQYFNAMDLIFKEGKCFVEKTTVDNNFYYCFCVNILWFNICYIK